MIVGAHDVLLVLSGPEGVKQVVYHSTTVPLKICDIDYLRIKEGNFRCILETPLPTIPTRKPNALISMLHGLR